MVLGRGVFLGDRMLVGNMRFGASESKFLEVFQNHYFEDAVFSCVFLN